MSISQTQVIPLTLATSTQAGEVLAKADKQGVACYLETMHEENLSFYRKHGLR